jgi:bacterioferritin
MQASRSGEGILSAEMSGKREEIVALLETAYFMELETVMNYVAASINPDGVRAEQVKESLRPEIQEELEHARQFARRIKELYGVVPGSLEFRATQEGLQPPRVQSDVVSVVRGVIAAEKNAVAHYQRTVEETEGADPVTQDMVIHILRDEQRHLRLFQGYLREYEVEGRA